MVDTAIIGLLRNVAARLAALAVFAFVAAGSCGAEPVVLRIAFLRSPEPMSVVRLNGTLEKRLARLGVKVEWVGPFNAYAPAAEGLNAGVIDMSTGSSTSALSSFAGDSPLSLFAWQWDTGDSAGILVKRDSPIRTLADLAGRTVAVNRGGSGDYNLAKALETAGVSQDSVKRAFLNPTDSAAAFAQNHVDAWSSWGMFFPTALTLYDARVVSLARDFHSENAVVYVVRRLFAEAHPDVIGEVLKELQEQARWARENRGGAAMLWENEFKVTPALARLFASYEMASPVPVGTRELAALHRTNDWMVEQKILNEPIPVDKHVFTLPAIE
jgi:sulfonate transport system substrate-binding protein